MRPPKENSLSVKKPKENKGSLFIVSGPSGAGKTSLLAEVIKQDEVLDKQLILSTSYTTREPRHGEVDGVNYFFISAQRFNQMQENEELLESAIVYDYQYGTGRKWVEQQLYEYQKDIILEIDVQGAMQVMQSDIDCCAIFIFPPSFDILKARLYGRQSDSQASIEKRLHNAQQEIDLGDKFHYSVINDDYQGAVAQIQSIIVQYRLQRNDSNA